MDNLFGKLQKGTKDTAQRMSLATRMAKLKVEIATQKSEKDRHIKSIGVKVYAIFAKTKQLDGRVLQEEISSELNLIERIDRHIEDLQQEISQLQAEFRNIDGKDHIVDASEVHETDDDPSK